MQATTKYKSQTGKNIIVTASKIFTVEVESLGIYNPEKVENGKFDLGIITINGKPVRLIVPASAEALELWAEWKTLDDQNFARALKEEKEYCDGRKNIEKAMR